MISIDNRDPRPLYEQVVDGFRKLIVAGVLAPHDKLPSVRALAAQLAINPNTIQRAYRELEAAGYIYSTTGKGSFVAPADEASGLHREELLARFDSCVSELIEAGVEPKQLVERIGKGGAR